ncbi:hypothetical protein TTRE_0000701401 [Trichuris trichiura]|uniref:Uncharacterized protein n=1 Tax=Trichuris trichiura TaxID=36087 RepID=A0A077ZFV8_TRITR|nr:hypothetical protein TTRE_0000701401 [Trichuris trichiura]
MRREYSVDDFRAVVHFMQTNVPDISIATDVICGFPTETDEVDTHAFEGRFAVGFQGSFFEDFSETMKLIDQYKFPTVFINQFYPRPGTKAAAMKLLPTEVVKQRTKMLTALFHSYQPYANRVGRVYKVLVAEKAFRGDFLVAHNKAYEQVGYG